MHFESQERGAESPLVNMIWRTHSGSAGSFVSRAACHWEIVVTRQAGGATLTLRGPETRAAPAPVPAHAEFFGIVFNLGVFMPHLPTRQLVDGGIHLPDATGDRFWLQGATWQLPDYDNADTFIDWLVRDGLLASDPVVAAALAGHATDVSRRTLQRRFVHATGMTHKTIQQIERARAAVDMLAVGHSIVAVASDLGFSDQAHLTHSLKHFIGQTPAQIAGSYRQPQTLSTPRKPLEA